MANEVSIIKRTCEEFLKQDLDNHALTVKISPMNQWLLTLDVGFSKHVDWVFLMSYVNHNILIADLNHRASYNLQISYIRSGITEDSQYGFQAHSMVSHKRRSTNR